MTIPKFSFTIFSLSIPSFIKYALLTNRIPFASILLTAGKRCPTIMSTPSRIIKYLISNALARFQLFDLIKYSTVKMNTIENTVVI